MSYTGNVSVGGPADTRELPGLTITKVSVGPMDNNAYLLRCIHTGELALIDAANDPGTLLGLIGDTPLAATPERNVRTCPAGVRAAGNSPVPADRLVGPAWLAPAAVFVSSHIGTLMPRLMSQTLAGQEVQNPMIMPTCMRSQNAAALGMSVCGAGNSANVMIAIQPKSPTSKAVSDMKSALTATISPSLTPRPRMGAIAPYWKRIPRTRASA